MSTDIAVAIVKRVSELSDRSSPDDWPEAMLVTSKELAFIVSEEVGQAIAEEREECAKIAELRNVGTNETRVAGHIAKAIRERGSK